MINILFKIIVCYSVISALWRTFSVIRSISIRNKFWHQAFLRMLKKRIYAQQANCWPSIKTHQQNHAATSLLSKYQGFSFPNCSSHSTSLHADRTALGWVPYSARWAGPSLSLEFSTTRHSSRLLPPPPADTEYHHHACLAAQVKYSSTLGSLSKFWLTEWLSVLNNSWITCLHSDLMDLMWYLHRSLVSQQRLLPKSIYLVLEEIAFEIALTFWSLD